MEVCQDYEDLFKLLNTHKVRYLIVGAYAVIYYTRPRFTKDIDIWVSPTVANSKNIYKALQEFGSPIENMTPADLTDKKLIYQIGVPPVRIDIITDIAGISFDKAWKGSVATNYGETLVRVIGLEELIVAKHHSNRDQDRVDIHYLLKKRKRKLFSKER